MSDTAETIKAEIGPVRLYPDWYYRIQILLMAITGLVLLIMPVHSSRFTSGVITIYLIGMSALSVMSVISDQFDMGWKFLIGIIGTFLFIVSMYYFFEGNYTYTETVFLIILTISCLLIAVIQIMRGLSAGDPLICLAGTITGVLGLVIIPVLYFSGWWSPVVTGAILITGGLSCYLLKNAGNSRRKSGRS
jgi:uncharacterized membrane protein HdeD (DUF308 family)